MSPSPPCRSSKFLDADDALLVRDAEGHHRPACAEEVLQAHVLCCRVGCGAVPLMSSPQSVKDHLRAPRNAGARFILRAVPRCATPHHRGCGRCSAARCRRPRCIRVRWSGEALSLNAAAVVLAHNHPPGGVEPSRADEFPDAVAEDRVGAAGGRGCSITSSQVPTSSPLGAWASLSRGRLGGPSLTSGEAGGRLRLAHLDDGVEGLSISPKLAWPWSLKLKGGVQALDHGPDACLVNPGLPFDSG